MIERCRVAPWGLFGGREGGCTSLEIQRGEYVAIMGPSGSGKSTLMNLIGCLDTPSRGSYLLNGKQVGQMNDSR